MNVDLTLSLMALIIQTAVLLLSILASAVWKERRITKIETKIEGLERAVKPIPGISRAVARLQGKASAQEGVGQ